MPTRIDRSSLDVAVAMTRLLEALMPPGWFGCRPRRPHPAYERYELLQAHIASAGTSVPALDDYRRIEILMELLLDGLHLITACGGDARSLAIGDLANYGDAQVQRRIRGAVRDALHFQAIMTEVSRAAFHQGCGQRVMAFEDPGVADLVVDLAGSPLPLIIDCKRVGSDSKVGRFADCVCNANRQIKAHGRECHGLVMFDLSDRARRTIAYRTNMPVQRLSVPPEVVEARAEVQRAMSGEKNRAVGGALLVWNEISVHPLGRATRLTINKRTLFVSHRSTSVREFPADLIVQLERGAGGIGLTVTPSKAQPT